jgi:hypothetical protein
MWSGRGWNGEREMAPVEMVMSWKPSSIQWSFHTGKNEFPFTNTHFFASSLSSHASYCCFSLLSFYDDDVSVRYTGEIVAIEIYVHKHSFLSLQLLTENWYLPYLSPRSQHIVELDASRKNLFECGWWQQKKNTAEEKSNVKGMSNIKDERLQK